MKIVSDYSDLLKEKVLAWFCIFLQHSFILLNEWALKNEWPQG